MPVGVVGSYGGVAVEGQVQDGVVGNPGSMVVGQVQNGVVGNPGGVVGRWVPVGVVGSYSGVVVEGQVPDGVVGNPGGVVGHWAPVGVVGNSGGVAVVGEDVVVDNLGDMAVDSHGEVVAVRWDAGSGVWSNLAVDSQPEGSTVVASSVDVRQQRNGDGEGGPKVEGRKPHKFHHILYCHVTPLSPTSTLHCFNIHLSPFPLPPPPSPSPLPPSPFPLLPSPSHFPFPLPPSSITFSPLTPLTFCPLILSTYQVWGKQEVSITPRTIRFNSQVIAFILH